LIAVTAWRRARTAPRLSVVVPVYNVEDYLAECLDSVLAQTYRENDEIEVILVDDGSTDGSAEIARQYADRHATWKLVRTANHGLGAARNRGAQEAGGAYLAFVDSDDMVPADAYALMIATLDRSGSDFVVGSVHRLIDGRLVEPEFLKPGVARRRIGVRAADVPPIIRNVFAWNKVFRRSFYDSAGLRFPEGIRYEDQPTTMRAYLLADRFDIVRRPVYIWRVRGERSSITQGRGQLSDLEDRLKTKALTSALVRTHGDEVVVDYWGKLALLGDMPVYFAEIATADDAYWARLVSGLREMLDGFPPIEQSLLRLPQRLVGWLVVQDRRGDAERVLGWLHDHPGPLSLRVEGDHVVPLDLPVASDPESGVPDGVRRLGEHELEFDARLVDVHWEGSALVVTGWALVRGAPSAGVSTDIRAELRGGDEAGGARVAADVERFEAAEATRWVGRGNQRYDDSGFTARFDLGGWSPGPHGAGDALTLWVEVEVDAIHRAGRLRSTAPELDPARLPETTFARVEWRPDQGLTVVRR
jgi:CDP-glycerol glycerophosphotransferase